MNANMKGGVIGDEPEPLNDEKKSARGKTGENESGWWNRASTEKMTKGLQGKLKKVRTLN